MPDNGIRNALNERGRCATRPPEYCASCLVRGFSVAWGYDHENGQEISQRSAA